MSATLLPNTPSTIASWSRFIAEGLEAAGVDSRALFLEAGIDLLEAENPNARFSVEKMSQVWRLAVERTGDPCFALSLAEHSNPGMYSALGMSIISSRTLGEAIHRGCRFSQIASDAASVSLRESGDEQMELVFQQSADHARLATPESMEAFMATTTRILRSGSRDGFQPVEVHFRHDREAFRDKYAAFFAAPMVFNAANYQIVFPQRNLQHKFYQSNPELAESIDNWMNEYLSAFEVSSLAAKVSGLLLRKLPDGEFTQYDVASELALSARSLQRGLQKEATSFKALLEQVRKDMALQYMRDNRLSLIEICCMLGFSDQSNFTKAFKRWTGQTPKSYRRQLQNNQSGR